ncbi:MAG TPA: PhzF family phenazine biosynthesis protein [Xanthomonadales bacterium]|nr:PhzF family phenazine biosynthesis protein [Xanthomonadales bacterium]
MTLRFLQLDVFADRPGGGNPLGVVIGAADWSDASMQAFAAWVDLVETTFLLPPTAPSASYRLRIFTPSREIAFAGHPTIGSAHAALATGLVELTAHGLVQECAAGLLPIRARGEGAQQRLFVQAPAARVLARAAAAIAKLQPLLGGIALGSMAPALVEGGRRWWMAELANEAELRAWRPDHGQIAALAKGSDSLGLCVFARAEDPGSGYQLVVRAFPAGVGIVEDPASGAANGLIGAYIALSDPSGPLAQGYRVSQGREIGRDAVIDVEIDGDSRVWVGGRTHLVIDGALHWPEN